MTNSDASAPAAENILIHAAYPLWRKHLLMTVARAKELQAQGNEVALTYCNARGGTCAVNYAGNPLACMVCRSRVKSTAKSAGLTLVPLETLSATANCNVEPEAVETDAEDQIAAGVQSGITSTLRVLPDDARTIGFLDNVRRCYQQTATGLLQSFRKLVADRQPDRIEVFNGRHACARFALIAARESGIPFNTLEMTATRRPIVFRGHTPHDRKHIQARMKEHPVDMQLAESFYEGRRQPRKNRFAKAQAKEFTPPPAEGFAKKVTIFLSSQDEFESLGPEWESAFDDYAAIIDQLCEAHPETLFCVRFHPNQADIVSDIISPFRLLAGKPNLRIYYPTDVANTYSLIEWSDTVVTFGSTVTVEACWMRKPVILLGPSFYDELGVSYTPGSMDEVHELLQQELPCKDRSGAAQFAAYFLTDGDSMRYVQEGKPFKPVDFNLGYPLLSRLARFYDNVHCHWQKARIGRRTRAKTKRAA